MRPTIFHEDWWLDATAPGRWREIVAKRGGRVVGSLRFVERMMGGMKICEMPPITRLLGPVIAPSGDKAESRLRHSHAVTQELLEAIGGHDHVEMTLEESCGDLSSFLSQGFDVRVLPTFLLDCRQTREELWGGLRDKTRNAIRRARERLDVQEIADPEAFTAYYISNLGDRPSYFDTGVITPAHRAALARGAGRILAAVDQHDVVHAAVFFIWDAEKVYYFLSTRDRATADLGAVSLLIWAGVEMAHDLGRTFDFDGVTTETRFRFMSAFGGRFATRYLIQRTTPAFEKQRQLRGLAKAILPDWLRPKPASEDRGAGIAARTKPLTTLADGAAG